MNVGESCPALCLQTTPSASSFLLTSGQEEGQRRLKESPAPQLLGTLVSGQGTDRALEGQGWARMCLLSSLWTVGHLGLARWLGLSVRLCPQTFLVAKGAGLPPATAKWGSLFSPSALTSAPVSVYKPL